MIDYRKSAKKFILSQTKTNAIRLFTAIEQLPNGDVKPIKGKKKPPLYRLRVGKYRVIFCYINGITTIIDADNRGDIYK